MKVLSALFGLVVFAAALVFAIANRQNVTLSLWPFDAAITAPLYLIVLGSLAAGLFLGGAFIWLGSLPHRFVARRLGKDVALLSGRLIELEREVEQHRARAGVTNLPLPAQSAWRFWERF